MDTFWIGLLNNLVGAGVVIAVVGWLLKRYVDSYDERLKKCEDEAEHIKTNYNDKFAKVHIKVDDAKDEIMSKIEVIKDDKAAYRQSQAAITSRMEEQIKNIFYEIKQLPKKVRNFGD